MKGKMLDTYEKWEQAGQLKEKFKAIKEMVAKRATQRQVAEYLGITEKTLISIRKKHPKLNDAFNYGNEELKVALMDAIYKKAVGFEYEETQTIIEETKTGNKKRITRYKKQSLPDVVAIKYLLVIHFGNEFNEKKAELELMARRLEKDEEVWKNENRDETDIATPRVRKQSKK
ncbi:MAG: hypothetical protein RBT59_08210 [Arcobacteraceae bacterium]|jgi:DNA-binding XRE family transcriptional regulator|nr:hypothetical protein [Arcobacteraceae bacterium]